MLHFALRMERNVNVFVCECESIHYENVAIVISTLPFYSTLNGLHGAAYTKQYIWTTQCIPYYGRRVICHFLRFMPFSISADFNEIKVLTSNWIAVEVRRTYNCARKQKFSSFLFCFISFRLIFNKLRKRDRTSDMFGINFHSFSHLFPLPLPPPPPQRTQNDLLGQSLLNLTHPEDQAFLKRQLIPTDLERLIGPQPEDENGEPRVRTADEEAEIDQKLKEDKRSFTIRSVHNGTLNAFWTGF